ncbi:MAG: cation transporter [candidate division NC10 bacterium]|nr:cation transporter [candidate division NC10 bacterium]
MVRFLAAMVALLLVAAPAFGAAGTKTVTLNIAGLTSTGCSSPASVRGTIKIFPGVRAVEVTRERGEATVEYVPEETDLAQLVVSVERSCRVKVTLPSPRE